VERIREEYISKPNEDLLVESKKRGEAMVFRCKGAFSLVNRSRLKELEVEIAAAPVARIIVDLLDVSFMDSSGLGTLASALKKMMEQGKKLMLVPNSIVRKTLETAGLHTVFQLFESVDDALQSPSH